MKLWSGDIKKLQRDYWNLNKKFNPTLFNPNEWADIAEKSGMKYLVFSTQHHDGFNMFDTKFSDYKVTGEDKLPKYIELSGVIINVEGQVLLLGYYKSLKLSKNGDIARIEIPEELRNTKSTACIFKICGGAQ